MVELNETEQKEYDGYMVVLQDETTSVDIRIDVLIKLSHFFIGKDFSESFKYASLATIITDIPRADACCCLGDMYLIANKIKWAKIWYRHALDDSYREGCDCKYWTYLPLVKFAQIDFMEGQYDSALNLVEALLIMRKDDVDILELKEVILSKIDKK